MPQQYFAAMAAIFIVILRAKDNLELLNLEEIEVLPFVIDILKPFTDAIEKLNGN